MRYLNLLVKQFEKRKDMIEITGGMVIRENEKFIVITCDKRLEEDAKKIFPRLTEMIVVSDEELKAIVTRYTYAKMSDRIILGGINNINGRNCAGLLNKASVTLEEILAVSILGIERRNFITWKLPEINEKDIKNEDIRSAIFSCS